MTMLSLENTAGVGTGILMPKFTNRFEVRFYDEKHEPVLPGLTAQVKSVSPINVNRSTSPIKHREFLTIVFEDDAANVTANGVADLWKSIFHMDIFVLDGNGESLSKFHFTECKIDSVCHSGFDYAGNRGTREENEVKITFDRDVSSALDKMENVELAQAFALVLGGLRLSTVKSTSGVGARDKIICLSYESVKEITSK